MSRLLKKLASLRLTLVGMITLAVLAVVGSRNPDIGTGVTIWPIALLVFNLLAGAWLRSGTRLGVLLLVSLSVQAAIWGLLPLAGSSAWVGIVLLVGYGCSAGVVPTCLFAMPSSVLGPGGDTASGFGLIMTGRNLGVLIGPVLLAWLVDDGAQWSRAQMTFAALTTAVVGVAWAIMSRLPARV